MNLLFLHRFGRDRGQLNYLNLPSLEQYPVATDKGWVLLNSIFSLDRLQRPYLVQPLSLVRSRIKVSTPGESSTTSQPSIQRSHQRARQRVAHHSNLSVISATIQFRLRPTRPQQECSAYFRTNHYLAYNTTLIQSVY